MIQLNLIRSLMSKRAVSGSVARHPPTTNMWKLGDGVLPQKLKVASWNVNGFRSLVNKGSIASLLSNINLDILCLNQTKVDLKAFTTQNLADKFPPYHQYWNFCKVSGGYSGVAVYSKIKPISVHQDFTMLHSSKPDDAKNLQGRLLTLEFQKHYLLHGYIPNSGADLQRIDFKQDYMNSLIHYMKFLVSQKKKKVILCGDMNIANQPIDLARPKDNQKHSGYTLTQRNLFKNLIKQGFVDTFRHLHPRTQQYTWWSSRLNSRIRNIGWRIDYFIVDQSSIPDVTESTIMSDWYGSDHCPIYLQILTD